VTAPARLRSLRLVGFKSFAERTTIEFGPGISAIVGPNGSGKSNLADAVRWAFGEQGRSLRTRRGEEVIFAGSQTRRATGMADVTLVLDNADGLLPLDFREVAIGRRLFRSGENEYLLNRQRIRHRDLIDLLENANLSDNAFLFIGQGMVDQALSLRPDERRLLFEEVAGVRRHERRRRLAREQLAEAEENLVRLDDILAELRPRVRRLEQQVRQEQVRRTAADDLAAALVTAASARWATARLAGREAAGTLETARHSANQALERARTAEQHAAVLSRRLAEGARIEASHRAAVDAARQRLTDARLMEARVASEIEAHDRDRRRLNGERASVEARLAEAQRVAARPMPAADPDLQDALDEVERQLADARAEVARMRSAAHAVDEHRAALRRAEAARATELDAARRHAGQAARRANEQDERVGAARDAATQAQTRRIEAAAADAAAASRETEAERAVEAARRAVAESEGRLHERTARSGAAVARLEAARSRLAALEEHLRADESQAIVAAARRRGGHRVAEGLDVEPRLRRASEAALGVALWSPALAAERVPALRGERGTVVIADGAAPRTAERDVERAVQAALAVGGGRLADAVRHDPAGIAVRLLTTALWVPDLAAALDLRAQLPAGWSVATPDGEVVTAAGLVTLGTAESLLERHAERDRLAAEIAELESQADQAIAERDPAGTALAAARATLERGTRAVEVARRDRRGADETERAADRRAEATARELAWEVGQAERLADEARRAAQALAVLEPPLASGVRAGTGAEALLVMGPAVVPASDGEARAVTSHADVSSGEHDVLAALDERVRELRARRDRLVRDADERAGARRRAEDARSRAEATMAIDEGRVADIGAELGRLAETIEERRVGHERAIAELAALREREQAATALLVETVSAAGADRERLAATEAEVTAAHERLRGSQEAMRGAEVAAAEGRLATESLREQLLIELASLGPTGLLALREAARPRSPLAAEESPARAGRPARGAVRDDRPLPETSPGEDSLSTGEEDLAAELEVALEAAARSWDILAAPPPVAPSAARLSVLRRRFHELGASDPYAAEEFAEVRARTEDLDRQRADLVEAIDQTRSLIAELETRIAEQFRTTFRELAGAFERHFTTLFGGGVAKLGLTDPDDIETTGIDVVAQPPGKKRQHLAMLSGGERALTAVALLFAMLEVRPVPFCVLDEVDAALDEQNVSRFATSLRSLADRMQCIVITHNRGTIECADSLYGVTIGEDAVTRVVSLRLEDAVELVEREAAERVAQGVAR
jgi:chromosome segregation protein